MPPSSPVVAPNLVVIGAGPAGLTAAMEAVRRGLRPLVLEQSRHMGGISRTETHRGYRFDIGGHRFFTRVPEVMSLWQDALGPDFRLTPRQSRIYYNRRFYSYPLNLWETFHNLGPLNSAAAALSFAQARIRPSAHEESLEQWVVNRFGRRLYETFFKTYTEKVWGIPCSEIRAEWAAQRIQNLTFATALRQALRPRASAKVKSLIKEFHYPRLGPGQMWDQFASRIRASHGEIATDTEVLELHHRDHQVTHLVGSSPTGTHSIPTPRILSSMALADLIARLRPAPPSNVLAAAQGLRYRDFLVVGLVLRRKTTFADNWIYIHAPEVRVGRIQNFGNWSPDLVPEPDTISLGLEYFCNQGDPTWSLDDDELISLAGHELEQLGLGRRTDILWGHVIRQRKAYPVYDSEYRRHLDVLRGYLATFSNLQTIGRNGMHRYNNQDHSMLTGIAAVQRFLGADADPWEINTERSYHEEQQLPPLRPISRSA